MNFCYDLSKDQTAFYPTTTVSSKERKAYTTVSFLPDVVLPAHPLHCWINSWAQHFKEVKKHSNHGYYGYFISIQACHAACTLHNYIEQ